MTFDAIKEMRKEGKRRALSFPPRNLLLARARLHLRYMVFGHDWVVWMPRIWDQWRNKGKPNYYVECYSFWTYLRASIGLLMPSFFYNNHIGSYPYYDDRYIVAFGDTYSPASWEYGGTGWTELHVAPWGFWYCLVPNQSV